ncbi:uncharacterized protein EI90DRAFT_3069674 [Cantharellus anzutake]|uniref:uncharacterized protein n=1 Tax=Cantharellus anzutake TaxID=1750568 RepID=UPI001902F613|nr:uncharacterized protein EI90DRAFT_3069674 [Cantharellus anzutake]KAF8326561.1 hypothetical protein EI90DRAFT_3069674 [Cantharellus anzutake]
MSSPPDGGHFDYADGTSPSEINDVLAQGSFSMSRTRRDSQVGSSYGAEDSEHTSTAIFDGYGAGAIPSSVTSMHHDRVITWTRDRRTSTSSRNKYYSSRRPSVSREGGSASFTGRRKDSQDSAADEFLDDERSTSDDEHTASHDGHRSIHSHASRSTRQPKLQREQSYPASTSQSSTMFWSLAGMFSRGSIHAPQEPLESRSISGSRRSSLASSASRKKGVEHRHDSSPESDSDNDDGTERWGYSSGEDVDEDEEDRYASEVSVTSSRIEEDSLYARSNFSRPPSPTSSLPIIRGGPGPFFGETRVDMGEDFDSFHHFEADSLASGPPCRQTIYIEDDDMTVLFIGREIIQWKSWLWTVGCFATLGALGLIGFWNNSVWIRWATRDKSFEFLGDDSDGVIVIETPYRDVFIEKLHKPNFPLPLEAIFPPSRTSSASRSRGSNTSGPSAPPSVHPPLSVNGSWTNGDAHRPSNQPNRLRLVEFRHLRFVLDHSTGLFRMLRNWRDPDATSTTAVRAGLPAKTRLQRSLLFGPNIIDLEGKSTFKLLIEEALNPFYVFQAISIVLWCLDDYYYYAFCIALISCFSIITTLVETKKTVERMRELSRFSCPVQVFLDGQWSVRSSTELVPGDLVNIMAENLTTFPADFFLLSGDAIVNESMLTGESVPIGKVPIKDQDLLHWREGGEVAADLAKGFLYTGTRVVRARGVMSGPEGEQALAVVARTGYNTTKGSLIRSMLFPKPMDFEFYRDSLRFIAFLACIAALGFLASTIQFIKLGVKWHTMILRALDLITVVVPPALPATLSIGTSFAVGRLRKLGIFCISPNRVNVAGKINVACFDKTGTLTEDGLDILGVRSADRTGDMFGELLTDINDLPTSSNTGKTNFLHALATCHSLKVIDGVIMGDPLDVKMFEFASWTIEEGKLGASKSSGNDTRPRPAALVQAIVRPPGSAEFRLEDALRAGARHAHFLELGVIRIFDFVSSLRRMSVIVKRLKSTSMEIYVKGAPEVMSEICDPVTFPRDYDDLLNYYTKNGYRVIAMAGKTVEGLSWLKAQRMKREQAEAGLHFLGLIIFENKLKPGTAPAIQTLRGAHIAIRMATGDNHRTAISVARECGIISQSTHVFFPTFISAGDAQTPDAMLMWSNVDDEVLKLDSYSLKPLPPPHDAVNADSIEYQDYTLAIPGDVFRWMINNAPLETLQRMFVKAQIFARMSPDEKHELVSRLQSLGYTVAFCGDGANDCGALKAADVGLSLSEAEASVAAPFTSQTPDITCVLEVIKEGRAALVTSFSCFKYMALYSLIQFTTITLLYSFASSLGDFQFLYIDLFIIIPIAVTMGRTHPFPRIHPQAPTASLISKKVLSSIIGQLLVTSCFQLWVFFWVRSQPWYSPPIPDTSNDSLETLNYENTVLFLLSSFQYILVAAVFSIGPPYRLPMQTNALLMISIALLTAFSTLILLAPPKFFASVLEIMLIPLPARIAILIAVVTNTGLCSAFESWAPLAKLVAWASSQTRNRRKRAIRDGKLYKAVEGG